MTPARATSAAAGSIDPRRVAHQILSEDRFRSPPLPRPLHGVLDALGGTLAPVGEAIDDAFSATAAFLPGGRSAVWVLLGIGVLALAAIVAARLTDRTLAQAGATRPGPDGHPGAPDARALEAASEAAEGEGRYAQAVRLRFQAGLLRLDELGALAYRPSLPNAAVSRRLGSPVFDTLARRFEEIVYGARPAEAADAGTAREAWHRLFDDARRR